VHQFLAPDDGRDGLKLGDEDQAFVTRRVRALAKEDHFNSEETPGSDNFLQTFGAHASRNSRALRRHFPMDSGDDGYEHGNKEFHARDADSSNYSVHQFLAPNDGRDGPTISVDDQAFATRRAHALARNDRLNIEETPGSDVFIQRSKASRRQFPLGNDDDGYEYGDRQLHARDADSSDYSVRQFLASDDGRDGANVGDDDRAFAMRRSRSPARQDHFNSEETPSSDNFLQTSAARATKNSHASRRQLPMDSDADGYEYGDKHLHAGDASSSDYSTHRLLEKNDGSVSSGSVNCRFSKGSGGPILSLAGGSVFDVEPV